MQVQRLPEPLVHILVGKLAEGFPDAASVLAQERELRRLDRRRDADAPRPSEFWPAECARFRSVWNLGRLLFSVHA